MRRRLSVLLLALIIGTSITGYAQEPDSAAVRAAFDSIVTANTYTATIEGGRLTGPGADWLVERGREVDHFLMGERHGTAEIPVVAATLYERLSNHGYGPVALEVGPYAGEAVTNALRKGGYPALKQFFSSYQAPVIPFLNWKAEAKMAARMVDAGAPIWGIDYEFIFSLPMHLDSLAQEAETEREADAVRETRRLMKQEWGGAGGEALGLADPSSLRDLRAAFEPRGDEDALKRIDALRTSNAIYAPYVRETGSFFDSRTRRENLMKQQLIEHIQEWESDHEEAPNVFHKNAHVMKRQDEDLYIPLGAFMSEWARARGEETFHVLADCHGGQIPKTGQGGGGECEPWLGGKDSPFAKHLRDDEITVIDMRALRSRYYDWEYLPEEIRRSIVTMDAYVAIPDVERSEPLSPLPRGE